MSFLAVTLNAADCIIIYFCALDDDSPLFLPVFTTIKRNGGDDNNIKCEAIVLFVIIW
jgi:hypothetical protein